MHVASHTAHKLVVVVVVVVVVVDVAVVVVEVSVVVVVVADVVVVVAVVVVAVMVVAVVDVDVLEVDVVLVWVVEVHSPPAYDSALWSHFVHRWSLVGVAAVETYSPGLHGVIGSHCRFLTPGIGALLSYSPSAQSLMVSQTLFWVAEAFSTRCSLSSQSTHGEHSVFSCDASALKVPYRQSLHVGAAHVDSFTYCPGPHMASACVVMVVVVVVVVVAVVVVVVVVLVVAIVVVVLLVLPLFATHGRPCHRPGSGWHQKSFSTVSQYRPPLCSLHASLRFGSRGF